jgi:hypothetical protein
MSEQIKARTKLVKHPFNLVQKQESKNLKDFILQELKDLDISTIQLHPDFLKFIASLIENQVKKKNDKTEKVDKMKILIEILQILFPHITDEQIRQSKDIIEFLLKNKMIQKIKLRKVTCFYLKKRFF